MIRIASPWTSAAAVAVVCWGCGGGGGGGTAPGNTTPPPSSSSNPCATGLVADEVGAAPPARNVTEAADRKRANVRGQTKGDVRDLLWTHRAPRDGGDRRAEPRDVPDAVNPAATEDVGEIAVIEDDGTIFLPANAFDLANTGLRFRPSGGGYEVSRVDAAFRTALGTRLTLGDDDTARVPLPSALSFFGGTTGDAFVNSDGNITFGVGDGSSSARSVGRFLGGAPRLAAFFADLDPSVGGRVFANAEASGLTVTWCAVPGFDDPSTVTVQTTVQADGTVDIRFGAVSLLEGVVGVSPGAGSSYAPARSASASRRVPTPIWWRRRSASIAAAATSTTSWCSGARRR